VSEPRQCQWVDREPMFIKRIGNFVIDRSEYEDERGAFFRYKETECRFIADEGKKFCPKHELVHLLALEPKATA